MTTSPGKASPASGRVRIAAATVPGATHLRRGRPNQDAVGWLPASGEGERLVMAVSDGHGGAASPRSHLGSQLAVDVATRLLWKLPTPLTERALRDTVQEIANTWRREVQEHLDRNPLSDAEIRQGAEEPAPHVLTRLRECPILAYGATLVFAVIDADQLGLGQLGDGDILLVSGPGDSHRPLPADTRLMGHTTTSLCDDDPLDNTRLAVLPLASRLVILSTDGYANSFADDASFLQVGTDLLAAVDETGITHIRQSLPTWLAETSQQGAGDDISVAVALTALPGAPRQPSPAPPAARPAVRPVRVRPVRPAEPSPAPAPQARAASPTHAERSPKQIVRLPVTRPAAGSSAPPAPPLQSRSRERDGRSVRPDPPLGQHNARHLVAVVAVAGLVAVLGLAVGWYLLLDNRGGGQLPPAPTSSPVLPRTASPAAPAAVSWVVSDDALTVQRRADNAVVVLLLPFQVKKLLEVPHGALLLLANGQVGLLPASGALSIDGWPTVKADDLVREGNKYYLLDGSGNRVQAIDPRTGAVSPPTPEKEPTPFTPVPRPRLTPTGGGPSEVMSVSVMVRMSRAGAAIAQTCHPGVDRPVAPSTVRDRTLH
jgi:hypothetical protein